MSLKTVTIALDHKLRSLRNSSVDSDRDVADTGGGGGIGTPTGTGQDSDGSSSCCYNEQLQATPTRRSVHHSRPLTLGENIPYADESPERPLIQSRAKPLRQLSNSNANGKSGICLRNEEPIEFGLMAKLLIFCCCIKVEEWFFWLIFKHFSLLFSTISKNLQLRFHIFKLND